MPRRSRGSGLYPFALVLASSWCSPAAGQVVELNLPPVDEEAEAAVGPDKTQSPSPTQAGSQRPREAALPGAGGDSRSGTRAGPLQQGLLQNPQAAEALGQFMKERGAARAGRTPSGQDDGKRPPGGAQVADMFQKMLQSGSSQAAGGAEPGARTRGQRGQQVLDLMRMNQQRRSRAQGSGGPAEPAPLEADRRPPSEAAAQPEETRPDRAKDLNGGQQDLQGLAKPDPRAGGNRLVEPRSPRLQRRQRRPRRRE